MVVELKNISPDPTLGFEISPNDIVANAENAIATWHTHIKSSDNPTGTGNLSGSDYLCFLNWPKLRHFIFGTDGLHEYYVENGAVIHA